MEKTAHAIIWGFSGRTSPRNLFNLINGELQTWRGGPSMDVFLDAPLANLFAGFLLHDGGLETMLHGGADGAELKTHLYRRLAGYDVTVLRYRGCAITDAEINAAREQGVRLQVVDLEAEASETIE